jgi:DNA mismatch repair protein MutS2
VRGVNVGNLLDATSAEAIGFAWLRATLAPAGPYGDAVFAELGPFRPGEEQAASARAQSVARIAAAFDEQQLDVMREVVRDVPDANGAIARASMGDGVEDSNFLELQRFFDACERLDALTAASSDLPRTASAEVRACARAIERGRAGRFGFYLDDAFATGLQAARAALAQAQAAYDAARGRTHAAVAAALGREISLPEFIVMRADLTSPLPPGVRVVRETPTYLLCELDADESELAALRRRDEAAAQVARAEEQVRAQLSSAIRDHAAALDAAARAFGEADVLVAAARFARAQRCNVATIAADGALRFEGGRYVPLEVELATQGRDFTPIDLRLDGMAVLTGPNMGGKSVALRTCGFIATCAAYGLPVPAERAHVTLFAGVAWLGIGDDATNGAGGLLSSFAREVVRLRDVLADPARPRLILLDEFARTTTPREGKALLVAVLERLRIDGACGLAATHLGGVAEAAGTFHYAVRGLRGIPQRPATEDLAEALETLAASMDYTLEEVTGERAREADAIALASLLGIDDAVIAAAHRAMELE